MSRRLRMASRIASIGLAGVLVFFGVFAVWSTNRSVSASNRLKVSERISQGYTRARFAMDDERLLEHQFMLGHGGSYVAAATPGLHRRFDALALQATTALTALERIGDPADRRLAAALLSHQAAYHGATDRIFAAARASTAQPMSQGPAGMARHAPSMGVRAAAMGRNSGGMGRGATSQQTNGQRLQQMYGMTADRDFNRLSSDLALATERRSQAALRELNALQATEASIASVTYVAVPLALLLVIVFWFVVRAYRRRAQQYTRAELQRLKAQALVDSLTGLRNHRAFQEDLDRAMAQADRSGSALTVVLIDLDGLKPINDKFGHQVGDERLKLLAESTRAVARSGDGAYRVGGDEFALVLADTRASGGLDVVERLQKELARLSDGAQTATSGIAEGGPGIDRDQLMHDADVALLKAKETRRAAIVYGPELEPFGAGLAGDGTPLHVLSRALANAVDAKDSLTRSHSETVATVCVLIANELGLDPDRVAQLRVAGLLHDIGKIGVPDAVLHKPGPLDEQEWELMKAHPVIGHGILQSANLALQADWVLRHHERIDGTGYPDGIAGDEVPLESRIILVADAFEAITSDRPYRAARPESDALAELARNAGTQFDSECIWALQRALDRTRGRIPAPVLAAPPQ